MKTKYASIGLLALMLAPTGVLAQEAPPAVSGPPLVIGTIARIDWPSGKHLRLVDGRYVDLHDYTVIDPEGAQLHTGQRIAVRGFFAPGTREGHVTLDARSISLINGDGKDH